MNSITNFESINLFLIYSDFNSWNWVWNWRHWPANEMRNSADDLILNESTVRSHAINIPKSLRLLLLLLLWTRCFYRVEEFEFRFCLLGKSRAPRIDIIEKSIHTSLRKVERNSPIQKKVKKKEKNERMRERERVKKKKFELKLDSMD